VDHTTNEITGSSRCWSGWTLPTPSSLPTRSTQREHAEWLVSRKHADWLLVVKHNQPALHQQLTALPWRDVRIADTVRDRGHGRVETRRLQVTTVAGLDFPHATQARGSPAGPGRPAAPAGGP
jgi:hypothetical protein